jgi:uncharacterized protein HemX
MDKSSQTLLVVFVAVAAVSILMQAGFTLAILIGTRKAQKKLMALADDLRLHALPVIMSSREIIHELTPKIKIISDNLTATSATLRSRADQIGAVVGDVANKTQGQITRVDAMVKVSLDQLTSAVKAIEHGVAGPVRQVNGIINGLRAGVGVLRQKSPNHLQPEDDLFV